MDLLRFKPYYAGKLLQNLNSLYVHYFVCFVEMKATPIETTEQLPWQQQTMYDSSDEEEVQNDNPATR